ncbi:hypothetical protein NBZ79_09580 [Sneathiella marina]|uniref:Uncharacterized protein n=1 Tax=Sneathiella marina TaxID=2950108 RepID=A0ABY4W8W7_9PROT|nr:hypothetical protein [Sneathiella marina]USG63224.1 hypothetical protein NBZ79_09580 [Sneathiella marina]
MSWLAGQSFRIELEEPVEKQLARKCEILKVNHVTCLIFGKRLAEEVLAEWERAPPAGVVLHKLDDQQRSELMHRLGTVS